MKRNPFIPQVRSPIVKNAYGQCESEFVSGDLSINDSEHTGGEFESAQHGRRFIKLACCSSVVFLVLVFFVFREVKHSRELYRMSRLVAVAEGQKRQWQERQRLDEAREAGLMAELLHQQSLPRDTQIIKASSTFPNRRR